MELRRILCNYCVTMEERSREDQLSISGNSAVDIRISGFPTRRPYERWGAGVEYHFQEFNEPYAPS